MPDSDIVTAAPTFIVFLNVDIPATSKIPVLTFSVDAIPVKLAPLIAGNAQVKFAAGKFVRFAPLIAGNAPVNFDAVTADNAESGTFVKLAPDPLNVVAVTIPAKSTPVSAKVTVPSPLRFSILLTLISDAIWVHFPPCFSYLV